MANVRLSDVQFHGLGLDFNRFSDSADRQSHILANCITTLKQDSRTLRLLESGMVDSYRITAQHERQSGIRPGVIRGKHGLDPGSFIADLDRRAHDARAPGISDHARNDSAVRSLRQKRTAQAEHGKHCN